jgi:hypothetical protein
MMRSVVRLASVLAMGAALLTCSDPSGPPPPGWLSVRLITPNLDDGGVLFTVSGARIDSVRSSYPLLVSRAVSETEQRVAVGGTMSGGVIAEIWVPDVRATDKYETGVQEVVVRGSLAQRATTDYAIEIVAGR